MRVLQVVGLLSPDAEYGGPTQVALTQARGLMAADHEVVIAAGTWGYREVPKTIEEVPVRLFPARSVTGRKSVRGLASPALLRWVALNACHFDVVHVHLGRDFVTMPCAWSMARRRKKFVVQTHGMVARRDDRVTHVFDKLLTVPALCGASRVFCLTSQEADYLASLSPGARLEMLRNGVAIPGRNGKKERSNGGGLSVVCLARLHERKRHRHLVEAAAQLSGDFPDTHYELIGPDEGAAGAVEALIAELGIGETVRLVGPLSHGDAMRRLECADLLALPSVDEPYPVSVLEALGRSVPVIVSDSCGLAELVREGGGGLVCEDTVDSLVSCIRLFHKADFRLEASAAALRLAIDKLSVDSVIEQLLAAYRA